MEWLVRTLVDKGWGKLGMSLRWLLGTQNVLIALVNDKDLQKIEYRYNILQKTGFFSGSNEVAHKQEFIKALFASDAYSQNAFSKALAFANSREQNPTTEPLSLFINFIHRIFFKEPSADSYNQTFIEAVFNNHEGESSALAHTARTQNPTEKPESNPLLILINGLTGAGCFEGDYASTNKQKFINAVFEPNKRGEHALYKALESRVILKSKDEDSCPNVTLLLNALAEIDCSSEDNAKIIKGILHIGQYGGVLSEAMRNPAALKRLLSILENADCFNKDHYKKAFITALFAPDTLGRNALSRAAHAPETLKIVYESLKNAGCFSNDEDKQKFINALFLQSKDGTSALSHAYNEEVRNQSLDMLEEAGGFDGPTGSPNQQAFVNAVFAKDEYGRCSLDNSFCSKGKLLEQLNKIHYFEGPFGEHNKQSLIDALFTQDTLDNSNALLSNCNFLFTSLMHHIRAAGCFSGPANNPNKKAFIDGVLRQNKDGKCVLSKIYGAKVIILLLEKLTEAGCFDDANSRKTFIEAVRTNGNAIVFHSLSDIKSYLALHKCLVQAGCSPQDITGLLNESIADEYSDLKEATPLMKAMTQFSKNDILVGRLTHDGAVLTSSQKQKLKNHSEKQSMDFEVFMKEHAAPDSPFDQKTMVAKARARLTAPANPARESARYKQIPLARRGSFSEHSLFVKKPPKDAHCAMDDINIGLKEKTWRC